MNDSNRSNGNPHDSPYGKLTLMTLCAMSLIAGICRQIPAHADEKSAVVSLADIDLSTTQGVERARARIHRKAGQLCSKVVDPWSLSHQPDYVRCVDSATAAAMQQLNASAMLANAPSDAGSGKR
jgi:UrcA family protein